MNVISSRRRAIGLHLRMSRGSVCRYITLLTPAKLVLMRQLRDIVGDRGLFLIYEDASPDGEDRDAWLRRWDRQKSSWTAFTPEEWDAITDHVHAADFPENAFAAFLCQLSFFSFP
jgi:hypothetical protein